jgi:hypothetical protein
VCTISSEIKFFISLAIIRTLCIYVSKGCEHLWLFFEAKMVPQAKKFGKNRIRVRSSSTRDPSSRITALNFGVVVVVVVVLPFYFILLNNSLLTHIISMLNRRVLPQEFFILTTFVTVGFTCRHAHTKCMGIFCDLSVKQVSPSSLQSL